MAARFLNTMYEDQTIEQFIDRMRRYAEFLSIARISPDIYFNEIHKALDNIERSLDREVNNVTDLTKLIF